MSMPTLDSSGQNAPKIVTKSGKPLPVALVIKKNRSITIRHSNDGDGAKLMNNLKLSNTALKSMLYREDIIYESRPDDFLKGNPQEKLVIVNTLDRLANASRTVAKYYTAYTNEIIREITSDNVVKLIGQKNYETVFAALCSVINQESKVRGILSLLTAPEDIKAESLTDKKPELLKVYEEKECQTDLTENCVDILFKMKDEKKRRTRRKQVNPYIVTDNDDPAKKRKRVIIDPELERRRQEKKGSKIIEILNPSGNTEPVEKDSKSDKEDLLPDIKNLMNEDSNCSVGNLSAISNYSAEGLLDNPNNLLKNVDRFTDSVDKIKITNVKSEGALQIDKSNWPVIPLLDGSVVKVPVKPEDNFHIAIPEIMNYIPKEDQKKLLYLQAYMDWKYCFQKDSDGYMPIHYAVINDDVPMLRRQCLILRSRHQTLDVEAADLTPLQMVLLQDTPNCGAMAATLLKYGADPLLNDNELKSPAHLAAEGEKPEALEALLTHCQKQSRSILQDHEELWKPEYANKSDEELSRILLDHMCTSFNGQGYTPLMIASSQGRHRNVELLLKACPWAVNTQSPNAGDTALCSLSTDSLCVARGYTPLMIASSQGRHRNVELLLKACPWAVNTQSPNAGDTALYIAVGAACMDCSERGNKSIVADKFKSTIKLLVAAGADLFIENLSGSSVKDLLAENNIPELSLLVGNQVTSCKFFDGTMPENDKNCDAYMLENCEGELSIIELIKGGNPKKRKAKGGASPTVAKNQRVKTYKKETKTTKANDSVETVSDKKVGLVYDVGVSVKNEDKITVARMCEYGHEKVIVIDKVDNLKVEKSVMMLNDDETGNNKVDSEKDAKTKDKPVILENKELPKTGATLSKPLQINSNVKFLQLHDKLIKPGNTSTSDPVSSVASTKMQNLTKIDSASCKIDNKTIQISNKTKTSYKIIDPTQLKSVLLKRKTLVKRKDTQAGTSDIHQKIILNPDAVNKK